MREYTFIFGENVCQKIDSLVILDWLEFQFNAIVCRNVIFKHTSIEDIGGSRPMLKFQSLGDDCLLEKHYVMFVCAIYYNLIS